MKIGIATCAKKMELTLGDRQLWAELVSRGAAVSTFAWTDPLALGERRDAILIRSVWDYHERPGEFLAWLKRAGENCPRIINGADVIRGNLDKRYLLALQAAGVPCVSSLMIPPEAAGEEALGKLRATGWRELVLKPSVSASAFLTFRVDVDDENLGQTLSEIWAHADVLAQPYLPSVEQDGEVSLIFFRDGSIEFSHAVLKRPAKGDFRVQAEFGGKWERFTPPKTLVHFGSAALGQIKGDWTFARVDVMDWRRAPHVGEIELIEPDLFLESGARSASRLAEIVMGKLTQGDRQ